MIRKVRIIGRKCVSKTLNFVLLLVETVFLMINGNTGGKKKALLINSNA